MSKKKLKGDGIFFTGKASDDVTGSQYYIRFGDCQMLLECGLHQSSSNDYLDSYKINSEKFQFKPSELDFVFVAHPHIDHCGLIPRLIKEGFQGKIIATAKTAEIMKPLLSNSCYILTEEAKILSKRHHREYKPLYDMDDVKETFRHVYELDEYNHIYELNDTVSFQWLRNAHCLGAAQLQLILKKENKRTKILYTSDLGALNTKNHYVDHTEIPEDFNHVVLMESTYGNAKKANNKKRYDDVLHLKAAIDTTIERKGTAVLPCFSFSRTQEILTTLYELYGDDPSFHTKIYVDSKLSCEISKLYSKILDGEDLQLWEEASKWKNVQFIEEKDDSRMVLNDSRPKIVISASGFCTNGRVVDYLKKHIPDSNSMIIFTGYTGDNPSYLSYRIKNYRKRQFISINKEAIANHADCITLSTFSSHAGHNDLITYGSSLKCDKLVLVHGDMESKKSLADKLKEQISKNNKTYRVLCAFKGMVIHL